MEIYGRASETTDGEITLKWKEPEDNGREITQYTVYQRLVTDGKVGEWTVVRKITKVSINELTVKLERGKVYEFTITATNELGESLVEETKVKRVTVVDLQNTNHGDKFTISCISSTTSSSNKRYVDIVRVKSARAVPFLQGNAVFLFLFLFLFLPLIMLHRQTARCDDLYGEFEFARCLTGSRTHCVS